MQYTAFLVLAPIACASMVVVLLYAWRGRAATEISAFITLTVVVAGWLISNTLELAAATPAWTLFWAKFTYLFIAAAPVAWLAFALQYTGQCRRLRPLGDWVLGALPLVTVLMVWTNEHHHLVWREWSFEPVGNSLLALHVVHGPWFWVHMLITYAMVAVGTLLILRHHLRALDIYQRQSRWLVFGALVPIVFNSLYIYRLVPALRKDYTPIAFALAGLSFGIGMIRDRLFDLKPVARATLIDTMRDAVLTIDDRGRVIDVNPAARELLASRNLGSDIDSMLGQPVELALCGWPELTHQLAQPGEGRVDLACPVGNRVRYYECHISVLQGADNRATGRLVVLHDITGRHAAEETLKRQMSELESSNEQLDAFADTVAHDLKGPLGTMIGAAEALRMMLSGLSPEQIEQYMDTFLQAGHRMTRIVDALLLLSRVYRQEDVGIDRLDMSVIVGEALDQVKDELESQAAEVIVPDVWPWATGYGPWVIEVWANYLTNAIKYGGTPPRITLGSDAPPIASSSGSLSAQAPPPVLRFWVRDNGQGLTGDQKSRLFMPFIRLHPSRATGQGLGLSIVRRIVERLGGQVGVDSEPGLGSTFWFTLPITELAAGPAYLEEVD